MNNADQIIEAVEWYQKQDLLHPLTCGKNSTHKLLYITKEKNNLILKCPDCDYTQNYIPESIMGWYACREDVEQSLEEMRKKMAEGSVKF